MTASLLLALSALSVAAAAAPAPAEIPNTVSIAAPATGAASSAWRVDPARYFPDAATEKARRAAALAEVDAFVARAATPPADGAALLALLQSHDASIRTLSRHDVVAQLAAGEDVGDHAAAQAESALDTALLRIDAALRHAIAAAGAARVARFEAEAPGLAAYRFEIASALRAPAVAAADEQASTQLAQPALASLGNAYAGLRREARRAVAATPLPASAPRAALEAADWKPYRDNEAAFAALLAPIATLAEGDAHLHGYPHAADAAYAGRQLTTAQVHAVLDAVRQSDAYARYTDVVARAAARRLGTDVAALQPWDLDAADAWQPPAVPFAEAAARIVAASRALGPDYARQFEALFDPAGGRVDWCRDKACDDAGFSVGAAGTTSALFYGHFDGDTDSLRATAHEAAHAVHRELMNEHQPVAAYNEGPHFLFEAIAIFNELVFLDRQQRDAATPAARAWYLHQFLEDATFQVYGSAQQAELEERLHALLRDGAAHTAAELDALAIDTATRYLPPHRFGVDSRLAWARNRLYFTDPFYDVNYLFAGVIALACLHEFERDPAAFAPRWTALLRNGFDDTPQALLKRFLDLDLDDGAALVRAATQAIDARSATLAALYAADAATASR